jgi:hypothetical protein
MITKLEIEFYDMFPKICVHHFLGSMIFSQPYFCIPSLLTRDALSGDTFQLVYLKLNCSMTEFTLSIIQNCKSYISLKL